MKTEYEKLNKEHQEAAQADMDKRLYGDFDEDDINFIKNQMEALHERGIQCYSFCQLIDKNGKECVWFNSIIKTCLCIMIKKIIFRSVVKLKTPYSTRLWQVLL